jgi:hypothetical protein
MYTIEVFMFAIVSGVPVTGSRNDCNRIVFWVDVILEARL